MLCVMTVCGRVKVQGRLWQCVREQAYALSHAGHSFELSCAETTAKTKAALKNVLFALQES